MKGLLAVVIVGGLILLGLTAAPAVADAAARIQEAEAISDVAAIGQIQAVTLSMVTCGISSVSILVSLGCLGLAVWFFVKQKAQAYQQSLLVAARRSRPKVSGAPRPMVKAQARPALPEPVYLEEFGSDESEDDLLPAIVEYWR